MQAACITFTANGWATLASPKISAAEPANRFVLRVIDALFTTAIVYDAITFADSSIVCTSLAELGRVSL